MPAVKELVSAKSTEPPASDSSSGTVHLALAGGSRIYR